MDYQPLLASLLKQLYQLLPITAGSLAHPHLSIKRVLQQNTVIASYTLLVGFLLYFVVKLMLVGLFFGLHFSLVQQMLAAVLASLVWLLASARVTYALAGWFSPPRVSVRRFQWLWIYTLWPAFIWLLATDFMRMLVKLEISLPAAWQSVEPILRVSLMAGYVFVSFWLLQWKLLLVWMAIRTGLQQTFSAAVKITLVFWLLLTAWVFIMARLLPHWLPLV